MKLDLFKNEKVKTKIKGQKVFSIIVANFLKRIPNVIGVASGEEKAEAVLGALRGGHINMLATNKKVAEYLINVGIRH